MPVLNKFCFCGRLHTGSVIIGWISAVYSLFLFVFVAVMMTKSDSIIDSQYNYKSYSWDSNEYSYFKQHDKDIVKIDIQFKCSMALVFHFISCVSAILLIVGAIKKNRYLILPYLIGHGLSVICLLVFTVILFMAWCSYVIFPIFIVFLIFALASGLQLYFWLCIISLFQHIQQEAKEKRIVLSNYIIHHNNNDTLPNYLPPYTKMV